MCQGCLEALRPPARRPILPMTKGCGVIVLLLIIALVASVAAVVALMQLATLRRRFVSAFGNGTTGSLEEMLVLHLKRVTQVDQRLAELEAEYERLTVTNSLASQKISIVRFNPFGDTGGDQSFTLAVLDAHDSGYVLTSIHGRQGTRSYVKPIDLGKSKYTLSDEEQQALAQAAKRVPK